MFTAPACLASAPILFYTMKHGVCMMDAPENIDIYACKQQ